MIEKKKIKTPPQINHNVKTNLTVISPAICIQSLVRPRTTALHPILNNFT